MDIINHPACTEVIGAPADITDGSCLGLPVAIVEDQYGMWSVSCWKPSKEELAVLIDGGSITLWVRAKGRQHPVVSMGVDPWKEENENI